VAARTLTIVVDAGSVPAGEAALRTNTISRTPEGAIEWTATGYGPDRARAACAGATVANTDVVQITGLRAGVNDAVLIDEVDWTTVSYYPYTVKNAAGTTSSFAGTGIDFRVDFGSTAVADGDSLTVEAGGHEDTLTAGAGAIALDAAAGTQVVFTGGQLPAIALDGGANNDSISAAGTTHGITALGGNGVDTITGGAGNDRLDGGTGNDTIDGGAGNDVVLGDSQQDTLTGGDGDDTVEGGPDDDIVEGAAGADRLYGENPGPLSITGDDELRAADGVADPVVDGGNGNDSATYDTALETPIRVEILNGSGPPPPPPPPANLLECDHDPATSTLTINIYGGSSTATRLTRENRLSRRPDGVIEWSSTGQNQTPTGLVNVSRSGPCDGATIANTDVIRVLGANAAVNDRLTIDNVSDPSTLADNRRLTDGAFAGTGIDFYVALGTTDVADYDRLTILGSGLDDYITAGTGRITLAATAQTGGQAAAVFLTDTRFVRPYSADSFNAQLRIEGGYGNDAIQASGSSANGPAPTYGVTILGGTGRDDLTGGSGPDYVDGGTGDDVVTGGPSHDHLLGDSQNDVIWANDGVTDNGVDGGNGTDTAHYDQALEAPRNVETAVAYGSGGPPPPTDPQPPTAPTGLAVSNVLPWSLTFSWNPSTDNVGVTGYDVYLSGNRISVALNATSREITGLTCGREYNLGVAAVDAAGNRSAQSTLISVPTAACPPTDTTPPTAPGNLRVTATGLDTVTLAWDPSTDAGGIAGYYVWKDGVRAANDVDETSVTLTGLACGRAYTFGVEALDNAAILSPRTTLVASTLDCPAPPPPGEANCSFDDGRLSVGLGGGEAVLSVVGSELRLNGTACVNATTTSTGRIVVAGSEGADRLVIDQRTGLFRPGRVDESAVQDEGEFSTSPISEIEIEIDLGDNPGDAVVVHGTAGDDTILLGYKGFSLDGDGDADILVDSNSPTQMAFELYGHGGRNTLSAQGGGGAGNPTWAASVKLFAGDLGDTLRGSYGADELHGGAGNDTLEGYAGNDVLLGEAGADTIKGGDGNDQLTGGAAGDQLLGNDGDDLIHADDDQNDPMINGATGTDTVYYDAGIDPNPSATEIKIAA
jgi:Ca2+-binding RTX toxin-like protein